MRELQVLKEFACLLVSPGRETRAIEVKSPDDAMGAAPGDLVVFEVGRAWPDRPTWFVLRRWEGRKRVYSFARLSSPDALGNEVRGRVLFVVREGGKNGRRPDQAG